MTPAQEAAERGALVKEALTWAGTPYIDHAEVKGVGCDCAGLLKGSLVATGLIADFATPYYHPQQWLKRDFEDHTYLGIVESIAYEITEAEVKSGDLVMYRLVSSWTHGGFVIRWPDFVLHCIRPAGVAGTHGIKGGFLNKRPRRFFRLLRWKP